VTRIDAHLHVWRRSAGGYRWLDAEDVAAIADDRSLDDAWAELQGAGFERVVLVQADDSDADTDHMLEQAAGRAEVAGVVGWLPLDHPRRAAARLEQLLSTSRLVGIRSLIHDRTDPDWIVRDEVDAGLSLLEEAGIPFDYVTASPAALVHLPTIAERHPGLAIVLDHLGKPPIGGDLAPWQALLRSAARIPNLTAKLSGLAPCTTAELRPVVEIALEELGADRLMYGGDWPVVELAGGYGTWWSAVRPLLDELSSAAHDAILGGTAARVYRMEEREAA
jgi:L-fuconolactonase